jgi:hypothetical protein
MRRILLRIRPAEVMDDLDLDLIRERAMRFPQGAAEVQDTRLSDAPYVSVIMTVPATNEELLAQLRTAFLDLPRMQIQVWRRLRVEVPLEKASVADLEESSLF